MKRLVVSLCVSRVGLSAVNADTVFDVAGWEQVECHMDPKTEQPKGRSIVYVPNLYQSELYLCLQYVSFDDTSAHISILNSQGQVVKDDMMQVVENGNSLFYIGDLDKGTYTIEIETNEYYMVGEFEV